MSEEKFMTFKDYLKIIKKLSKITDELEDMDNETGGPLSKSEVSSDGAAVSGGNWRRI